MTTIPSITELPTPVPQTSDPTNFDPRADEFLAALPTMVTEENASITAMNTVAGEVSTNASSASTSAATATTKAGQASTSATNAATSETNAATSEANALTYKSAAQTAASAGASYLGGFRNRLLNGAFAIDQRNGGVSTAISDDTYCFDRWYVLTQTAAVNVSQLTEPENGYPFAIRLTQNQSTAQRMGLAQIVEGVNCKDLRGQSGTLSIRARISSSQAIRYAILGWTGTEDSVTSDVVNSWTSGTYTAGNFFLASNISVLAVGTSTPSANTWTTLASLSASLGSSFKNIIVFAWTEGTAAQNVTLDFEYMQFEVGTAATAFERRDYGSELLRCQRYFETITFTNAAATGISTSTTAAGAIITYQVKKRAQPTVTLPAAGQSAGKMSFTTSTGGYPATTGTNSVLSYYATSVFIVGSSYVGLTSGAPSQLFCATSATITFDAEI